MVLSVDTGHYFLQIVKNMYVLNYISIHVFVTCCAYHQGYQLAYYVI